MKAIVVTEFGGPDKMRYMDIDMPSINSKQVLIRVETTSVNFADIKSRYGQKGTDKLPFIPGLDAAGVIQAIGSEVQSLKVGQRVIAFPKNGSYAEYIVADESLTFALSDNVDFDTAAACPIVSFTSYKMLADVARLVPGETVLIHAAADYVISHDNTDFAERVIELTDGQGADIILDSVSGWVSEKSLECLAMYGRLVNFGNASGEVGRFQTNDLHSSCRSVLGFSLGTTRKERPHLLHNTANHVLGYLAEAHTWVESRKSTGKVLLSVG